MNLLLFAGATEGRLLADRLRALPARTTVCTATDYGKELLAPAGGGNITFRAGRMPAEEMLSLIRGEKIDLVIDATHPYATAAAAAIRAAAEAANVPRLRLARAKSAVDNNDGIAYFDNAADAADALAATGGNVLLATGAKELAAFATVPGLAGRCYPRVLPMEESIRACAALGFPRSHIIAMQGPFSRDLNRALLRQYNIAVMVTKDGGPEGGFAEKLQAAGDAGARIFVLRRPEEPADDPGLPFEALLAAIAATLEKTQ